MKAINDNGTIKTFSSVPKSWGGKMGLQYASSSDLEAIGFYDLNKPELLPSQEYGDVVWDAENSIFTYTINNKNFSQTLAELKSEKIENLKYIYNIKLSKTDWKVIKSQELGESMSQSDLDARAALRSECNTKESEINSLSTKSEVVNYSLPNII